MDAAPRRRDDPRPAPVRLAPAPSYDAAWALVAPYRDRLVALAAARGLSAEDAQDVAHSVLCRAVEFGVGADRVDAYLAKATATRCREVVERAERQAALLARIRADDRLVGDLDDDVCDRAHARWLLGRLPDRERRVVALSVAGEPVTAIAARTGLSYPTVDRLLSRARRELRRLGPAV